MNSMFIVISGIILLFSNLNASSLKRKRAVFSDSRSTKKVKINEANIVNDINKFLNDNIGAVYTPEWLRELIKNQNLPENYEYIILEKAIKKDLLGIINLVMDSYKDKIYPCKFFLDKNKNLLHLAVEYGDNSMFDKLLATGQVGLNNIDIKDKENNRSVLESAEFLSRQPVINQEDYQDIVNKINNYKRFLNFVAERSAGNIPPEIAQKIASYSYNIKF